MCASIVSTASSAGSTWGHSGAMRAEPGGGEWEVWGGEQRVPAHLHPAHTRLAVDS